MARQIADAPRVLCFGEVLWDCLPAGRIPGGAPLNVAYHLHRLGADARMISAVGADEAGDAMLACLHERGVSTGFLTRHPRLPTGTVQVQVSGDGQPSYTIEENVAWDKIAVPQDVHDFGARAVVFGSLAARSAENRVALERLLDLPLELRFMDANLRPPFHDRERVLALAKRAEWLKVNEQELQELAALRADTSTRPPESLVPLAEALSHLAGGAAICVTCGERGAFTWKGGEAHFASAPKVKVRDTIGAGDAFTAAFVHGLLTAASDVPRILTRACALGALVASLPGGQPDYDAAPE